MKTTHRINGLIYITSEEEVLNGDWYITPTNYIRKASMLWVWDMSETGRKVKNDWCKIILTNDPALISDGIQAIEPDKTKEGGRNNRLIDNCKREHLPPLEKTELFLSKCKEAFDNPEKFFGGMFDWVMSESGCSLK